jgi:hypothetical protein
VKDHAFAVIIALSGRSPLWSGSVCFILAALHDTVRRMSGLVAFASGGFAGHAGAAGRLFTAIPLFVKQDCFI